MLNYERNVKSLWQFLQTLKYTVYRVLKDRLEMYFLGLEKVTEFPIQVWTKEGAHKCDYLFIPSEKLSRYTSLINQAPSDQQRN